MRNLFLLVLALFISSNILAQSKILIQSLEKMRNGYIINAITNIENEANRGDVWAQFFLGLCYENGYGVNQNYKTAFKLYRKTAESGLAIGQHSVAICYRKALGTSCNIDKAEYWEEKARDNYNPELLTLIDTYYQEGLNYPENYALNPDASKDILTMSDNNVNIDNNTTINITYATPQPVQSLTVTPTPNEQVAQSDVDKNIPQATGNNDHTFVVILANENYRREEPVPYANNDGEIFKTYCQNVLGIPEKNIKYIADASLNDLKYNLNWLEQVMEAYNGEAKAIFYYAGHGIPDEAQKTAYLLPVDGYGSDVSTGYKVDELYTTLGKLPSKSVTVFLDACFSGSKRDEGMLASARGVAIKAKKSNPVGNMVVFSAAQGDETAYPYKEQRHGMFTYYLLKKLQETKGEATLGEISDYVTSEVRKQSIVINGKMQTPTLTSSSAVGDAWRNWKLK